MQNASYSKLASEIRQQIELAVDIEDWDKAHGLYANLRELELENGAPQLGNLPSWFSEGGTGSSRSSAVLPSSSNSRTERSRSPRDWLTAGNNDPQPTDLSAAMALPVAKLKVLLQRAGIDYTGCIEKEDLIELVQQSPGAACALAKEANAVVIEHNKAIKQHLKKGDVTEARQVFAEMLQVGVRPTEVTFNEFLNFCAKRKDTGEALRLVAVMRSEGLQPNRVSVSIILKALDENTAQHDIDKVGILFRQVCAKEGVDDILLSSLAEACVRVGSRAPRLYATLVRILEDYEGATWGAQTCGSLIRAHGQAQDTASMWKRWNSMMWRGIQPTVVTTGCMVEQLVVNNQVNQAYVVIRDLENRGYNECINAVVYASLLKGFAKEKSPEKVWEVYMEMRSRRIHMKIETYDSLVAAFAECGMMERVGILFAEMCANGVPPRVRTFTKLAKGHCLKGDIKNAMNVMKQMTATTGLEPDEIFYNTLLDACAQHGLVDDGQRLLKRMEKAGMPRSKYTVTIIAKLMRHVDRGAGKTAATAGSPRVPLPTPMHALPPTQDHWLEESSGNSEGGRAQHEHTNKNTLTAY